MLQVPYLWLSRTLSRLRFTDNKLLALPPNSDSRQYWRGYNAALKDVESAIYRKTRKDKRAALRERFGHDVAGQRAALRELRAHEAQDAAMARALGQGASS